MRQRHLSALGMSRKFVFDLASAALNSASV
jgi:hypothetical protein